MFRIVIGGVLLVSSVYLLRRLVLTNCCNREPNFRQKAITVTGATSVLAVVKQLISEGSTVILAGRNRKLIVVFVLLSSIYLLRRLVWTNRCHCTLSLRHKTIIVTGATSGIGLALVKQLASEGATVILACRNLPLAHRIREQLILSTGNTSIEVEPLDLQSFDSIAAFAHRITHIAARPIYALVNNAAIFYAPPYLTVDQLDGTFQTNYCGPFLLTLLLLPALRANRISGARVVNLSSAAHLCVDADAIDFAAFHTLFDDSGSNRFLAYQRSKFYLVLFASRLRSLLDNTDVTVHCVDPGNAETAIYRNFPPLANWLLFALQAPIRFFAVNTPPEGAQGALHALRSCDRPFYVQRAVRPSVDYHPRADDPRLADQLWLRTRKLCEQHLLEL